MSDMLESTEPSVTLGQEVTPGQQLKAARLEAGISLEEAAKALFLTRHKLTALEEDDYGKLTSPLFVQGYIRKYASFLQLDGDALVASFLSINPPPAPEEIPPPRTPIATRPPGGGWLPWSGVAIALAIAIAVAIGSGDDRAQTQPVVASNERSGESEDLFAKDVSSTSDEPISGDSLELPLTTNSTAPSSEAAAERDTSLAQVAGDETEPEIEPDPPAATSAPAAAETADSALRSLAQASASNAEEGPSSVDQLAFAFLEECWIEVVDAKGEVLHSSIAAAGDTIALAGEAPFSVRLGNAHGVSLSLNGDAIPVEPRPGRRTHRMVVGE